MRHRKSGVKLNRTTSHRQAMFRNMVTSLLKYERIKTTDAKAKELRRWADHVITLAKRGDLHARRLVMAIVREKDVVHKIFEEASERFGSRNGGYTRIIKIGRRSGDAATLTLVELVSSEGAKPPNTKPIKSETQAEVKPIETETKASGTPNAAIEKAAPVEADASVDAHVVEAAAIDPEPGAAEVDDSAENDPNASSAPSDKTQ